MKKYLLPQNGNLYKANLHCHTKVSDGRNTPAEMKEYYKSRGYQVLAITDHELLVDHTDLDDDEFITLTGYEYGFVEKDYDPYTQEGIDTYQHIRTMEFNLFARDKHNVTHICFNKENVIHGEKWRCDTVKSVGREDIRKEYTVEAMQEFIDTAKANGFIVSLNHPNYSFESPEFFGELKGLFAMEIINQGSYYIADDYNIQMYDQMLKRGHRMSCIAADDNHAAYIEGDDNDIRPWGHVIIKAEELTHEAVFSALEKGDFYSSQGPRITELYVEDGKVKMNFEAAKYAIMHTKYRHFGRVTAPLGEFITTAEFNLPKDADEFVRFEIIDQYGRRAHTRAYFMDEIDG